MRVSELLPSNCFFTGIVDGLDDTQLDINSYKSEAKLHHSIEDVVPAGLNPAERLDCILLNSHEHSSQNSAFPSTG